MITIVKPKDRAAWLSHKRGVVGCSEAPALFGVHQYLSPFELGCIKLGTRADEEENPPMRRGRLLESVSGVIMREDHPTWRVDHNTFPDLEFLIDPETRMGCTPDFYVVDPDRPGFGTIQTKSVEASIFRKKWQTPEGLIEPPLWVAIQATCEKHMTGADWCAVAPLVVSHGVTLPVIEIEPVDELWERAKELVKAFWAKTDRGELYDPDFGKDADLIKALYGSSIAEKTIDLSSGDNSIRFAGKLDAELAATIKEAEEARKALKAEVLFKMGDAEIGLIDGRIAITKKTVTRKEHFVKASQFPQIRFKESS